MSDVADVWTEALAAAYSVARAARAHELRGGRARAFDAQGMHPFSLEVGRVLACQEIEPDLACGDFDAMALRRDAEREAERDFEQAIRDGESPWTRRGDADG